MDKLINILSELQIPNQYLKKEIDEIEVLSNKVTEHIKTFQNDCEEFQRSTIEIKILKEEEQSLITKIKDREKEFVLAEEKLQDLQSEYESLTRFDGNDSRWSGSKILMNLEYKMKLFGLDIQADFIEPTICEVKIRFSENKCITFNCDIIRNTYDLQAMEPRHGHFEEMRRLLFESGDIVGFLYHVRKFFGHLA